MEFPAETKTYQEIFASDFNKYIEKTFKTDYHYADTMDYPGQDTYRTYSIGDNSCGDTYCWNEDWTEETEFDLVRMFYDLHNGERHKRPTPDELLEGMYQMGMIPSGNYLFTIWW
jgi:hypothetical protein